MGSFNFKSGEPQFTHCATHSITSISAQQAECHAGSGKLQYIVPSRKTVSSRVRKGPPRLAEAELFEYAVRYLAQQSCSSESLKSKLGKRAANPADIEPVVARLKDIGYLNDRNYAESYAANRVDNDGYGKMRVLSDLRAHRVPPPLAEEAASKVFEGKNEADLIDNYIERRMPSFAAQGGIEDQRELAKAYRRLRRAGFASGPVLAALKRRAARPEEIDESPDDDEEDAAGR